VGTLALVAWQAWAEPQEAWAEPQQAWRVRVWVEPQRDRVVLARRVQVSLS